MGSASDHPAAEGAVRDAELRAWMSRHGPALTRFFAKRAGPAEAEDLTQEVFLRLQARAVAEPVENVERYLFKIARNVLVSRHRHDSIHGWSLLDPLEDGVEAADELSPERVLLAKHEYARAIVAVRKLPPRARAAFMFHRFDEMTYPAIARRMGISLNAVRHLMTRALAQLAEELERRP